MRDWWVFYLPKYLEDALTSNTSTGSEKSLEAIYSESLELSKKSQSIIPFMDDEIGRLEEELSLIHI